MKHLRENCPNPSWLEDDRETARSVSVVNIYGRERFDPQIDSYESMLNTAIPSNDIIRQDFPDSFNFQHVAKETIGGLST